MPRRDYRERTRIEFSGGWSNPTNIISEWCVAQPIRRFQSIQYRKDKAGVQHEFILILLQDERDTHRDAFCRIERTADPDHQLEAIGVNGTTAFDFVQTFDSYSAEFPSNQDPGSDVVAEIQFPCTFDLQDVLAICYGISCHATAQRYTLQQFNCYFYCWTIILCLARAAAGWERMCAQHWEEIEAQIISSIDSLDPTRKAKLALVLSQAQQGSFDKALRSELSSLEFSRTVVRSLKCMLWEDRSLASIEDVIKSRLSSVATKTVDLLFPNEFLQPVRCGSNMRRRSCDPKHLVRTLAAEAIEAGFKAFWVAFSKCVSSASAEIYQKGDIRENYLNDPPKFFLYRVAFPVLSGPAWVGLAIFGNLCASKQLARLHYVLGPYRYMNVALRRLLYVTNMLRGATRFFPSSLNYIRLAPIAARCLEEEWEGEGNVHACKLLDKIGDSIFQSSFNSAMQVYSSGLVKLMNEYEGYDFRKLTLQLMAEFTETSGEKRQVLWTAIICYDLLDIIAKVILEVVIGSLGSGNEGRIGESTQVST